MLIAPMGIQCGFLVKVLYYKLKNDTYDCKFEVITVSMGLPSYGTILYYLKKLLKARANKYTVKI